MRFKGIDRRFKINNVFQFYAGKGEQTPGISITRERRSRELKET